MPPRKSKPASSGDESIFLSRKERLFAGEHLRERLPHSVHAEWKRLFRTHTEARCLRSCAPGLLKPATR